MHEWGEAAILQLLINLYYDVEITLSREERELISKHSEGNFKHFVTHRNKDSTFMFTTLLQAKVKGF
jgi:hypothetical protein